jgi:hypothetical protein
MPPAPATRSATTPRTTARLKRTWPTRPHLGTRETGAKKRWSMGSSVAPRPRGHLHEEKTDEIHRRSHPECPVSNHPHFWTDSPPSHAGHRPGRLVLIAAQAAFRNWFTTRQEKGQGNNQKGGVTEWLTSCAAHRTPPISSLSILVFISI